MYPGHATPYSDNREESQHPIEGVFDKLTLHITKILESQQMTYTVAYEQNTEHNLEPSSTTYSGRC